MAAQAAKSSAGKPVVSEPTSSEGGGRLRWVLGWIVLPSTIIAALFLAGVHVGARGPDRALARMVLKAFGGKPGVAAEPEQPSSPKPRPGAKPGEPFSFSVVLRPKQLTSIAEKSLGLSAAELDCEQVCRAYSKAEYEIAVYSVEECELARTVSHAPSYLFCRGKLEASNVSSKPASNDAANDAASQPPKDNR
jgi:hypothetical protein